MAERETSAKDTSTGRGRSKTHNFRERLGDEDIQIGDYKVDDLRKIASEFGISGSHDMNKEELVKTINRTRHNADS